MKNNWSRTFAVTIAFALAFFSSASSLAQFQPALPGYRYEFPRDFFNHPGYQTEWWYYTGNLQAAEGKKFGFELTFFRQGISRDPSKSSPWDLRDIYFAHFAISDLDGKQFFHTERTNRAGPGIAGADATQQKIWNGNWSVVFSALSERHLTAFADSFALDLTLQSQKPPVFHGENGVSQKSAGPGRASHYFSETRLAAMGAITVEAHHYQVSGLAWMDHEFFSQQLNVDQAGWDWLSLQFDDRTELMLFRIRKKDGSIDQFSAGTFIDAQGRAIHLRAQDFTLEPHPASDNSANSSPHELTTWISPLTHAHYPIRWRIAVPSLDIFAAITTPLASQEMTSASSRAAHGYGAPSYWEGAVVSQSTNRSAPLRGSGYLEMTGYDHPLDPSQF